MRIKTTADIVNQINWHGLNFSQRYVLKTMIELSFFNRLIPRQKVYENVKMSKYVLASYLNDLKDKGFIERHMMLGCGNYVQYEVVAFSEMVPCV